MESQAAIKLLIKCTVTSTAVLNCIRNLNQSHLSTAWIPGHAEVHGNKVADYPAKSGSKLEMHSPERFITVPYARCISKVKDWFTVRWKFMWNKRKDGLRKKESVGWTS